MKDSGLEDLLSTATDWQELYFYNGEIKAEYSDSIHAYTLLGEDGKRTLIPGATSITAMVDKSGPLTWWAVGQMSEYFCQNIGEWSPLLTELYTKAKNKLPWDDEEPHQALISITAGDLAKLLNTARLNFKAVVKDASDVGHMAHSWLEHYTKAMIANDGFATPLPAPPPEARAASCVMAALDWMFKHAYRPHHAERKVYSREYGYMGTLDQIGEVTSCGDPKCCPFEGTHTELLDFKSSNNLYDEYRLQTACYQHAITEEFPEIKIHGRRLLKLGKYDGDFESLYCPNEDFEADFEGFVGALMTYNRMKQLELDRKYEKALVKAAKDALKPSKKRAPRRPIVREVQPVEELVVCDLTA